MAQYFAGEIMADRSGQLIEKFKLIQILGEGGMGAVYLAQHTTTDRMVALKILHESFANNTEILQRIRREAKAAALIGHPNIVEIVDSGTDENGIPYIAMELLKGESLDSLLERTGPMPVSLASYIIYSILDTLGAAHAKGVVHRDMKPENVFLHRQHNSIVPQIKILDFGISKFQTMEQNNLSLTKTGTVMGTPYYMSPEQAMGQKIDGRTDIYSVGIMLYQLLTNQLPFFDTNYNRVLLQIMTGTVPPMNHIRPDLPPEMVAIVNRAIARNLDERYPDCHSFMVDLQSFWVIYDPEEIFASISNGTTPIPVRPAPIASTPDVNFSSPPITSPQMSSPHFSSGTRIPTTNGQSEEVPKSKKWILPLVVGLVILVGIGIVLWPSKKEETSKPPSTQVPTSDSTNTIVAEKPEETPMEMEMTITAPMETPMEANMPVESPMETPLPEKVVVNILGVPKGASVLIDGKKVVLPAHFPGAHGMHSVVITAPGYDPFIKTIEYTQNVELVYDAPRTSKTKPVMNTKEKTSMHTETPTIENMNEPPPSMTNNMKVDFNTPDF